MTFPSPLVIAPLQEPQKQTFVILHGRGSSAQKFGPTLLQTEFPRPPTAPAEAISEELGTTWTLQMAFPHAKFIFPTASRNRATLYNRAKTNQWFDNWALNVDSLASEREELQAPGLKQTLTFLHGLLKDEMEACPGGAKNVILWGLSQGCAASLVSLFLWRGEPFGGVIGMCGWLPYALRIGEEMGLVNEKPEEEGGSNLEAAEQEDDPFERCADEEQSKELDPAQRAVEWLKDELELDGDKDDDKGLPFQQIPVFLGHSVKDDSVNIVLGRTAFSCLQDLGVQRAQWQEYEDLGHWYSSEMLGDIVSWIWKETGWDKT